MLSEVHVPDIGELVDVPVAEISVRIGQQVAAGDTLLIVESDKATVDVPTPVAGLVTALHVKTGDKVRAGVLIATLETVVAAPTPAPALAMDSETVDLLVIGAGPGGYTAAFRAADLGRKVVMIDALETLGGVCLNVGCIPSKALLHVAKVMDDAGSLSAHGVSFGAPTVDLAQVRDWKTGVVAKLTGGLTALARKRKVRTIIGRASFTGPNTVQVTTGDTTQTLTFRQAIIAAGSEPVRLPNLPDDPRVIDSTGALALPDIPKRLLVIGGGVIGLEMAQVYLGLGSAITVVELGPQLMPGADADIVAPLAKRLDRRGVRILTATKVVGAKAQDDGIAISFEGAASGEEIFDKVLCAVGRRPNGHQIGAEAAGVTVTAAGFIPVDARMATSQPHIFAIGDVVGQPMLAHKAMHEGKVAAEAACGEKSVFDAAVIPAVAYTDPEVAWVGLTETACKAEGRKIKVAAFPWAASGRALSMDRPEGKTKLIFDAESGKIIGAGIVGAGAGELIAEAVLAIEMGADAEDIGHSIHPHPTLSETIALAAEIATGTITDL